MSDPPLVMVFICAFRSLIHLCDDWGFSQRENTLKSKAWSCHYFKPLLLVLRSGWVQDKLSPCTKHFCMFSVLESFICQSQGTRHLWHLTVLRDPVEHPLRWGPHHSPLLGLLPLLSSKKSICCQTVKKQNQAWLHLALKITWHPGCGCLVFASTNTLQFRIKVSFFSVIFIIQFKSSWRRKQSAGVCFLPWAQVRQDPNTACQDRGQPSRAVEGINEALLFSTVHTPPPPLKIHGGRLCKAKASSEGSWMCAVEQAQLSARARPTAAQLHLLIIASLAPPNVHIFSQLLNKLITSWTRKSADAFKALLT